MFGIDDILLASLLGGGLGLAKTGNIKGGLLGAGLGAAGGHLMGAGGLLGGQGMALPGANSAAELVASKAVLPQSTAALLEAPKSYLTQAKPFIDAAGTGMQVAKEMQQPETPPVQGQPLRQWQPDYSYLKAPQAEDDERRKRMMQQFAQNAMMRG